jgi:isoquinoline 1-oxidoreductase alpha subunit
MKLSINGLSVEVRAAADVPLLWVLRDELGMNGTKYGCGMGLCGACTVHLDGDAIRSCQTPVGAIGGRNITTIEGLGGNAGRALHPVQQAWLEKDVVQCGYCQSGQVMAAAALLKKNGRPTDTQIDEAMAGNVCRCGTYERIRAGIHRAAELTFNDGNAKGAK